MNRTLTGLFTGLVLVCGLSNAASALTYTQGFENGWDGWTLWQSHAYAPWTVVDSSAAAHSGTHLAYSGILNSYREQYILSPEFTAGSSNVQLNFYHMYANGDDAVVLGISVNGIGQNLKSYAGNPGNLNFVISGYPQTIPSQLTSSSQYLLESINLSTYLQANDKFQVYFYTGASYNYSSPGWAVDDITLTGLQDPTNNNPPTENSGAVPEPLTAGLTTLSLLSLGLVALRRR